MGTLTAHTGFMHWALLYHDRAEYLARTVAFVRDGLVAGEPVTVAVPEPNLTLLRTALGESAGQVRMVDMARAGRNPGRIIPAMLRVFTDAHDGTAEGPSGSGRASRRVRIIGEPIWAGRTAAEYPACLQHEALINLAFAGRAVAILCPYDVQGLAPGVLEDASATHPLISERGVERRSGAYALGRVLSACNAELPEPGDAVVLPFTTANLAEPRRLAAGHATRLGLQPGRITDVELAVNELVTNSVVHGGGRGTLRMWTEEGHLVCEVRDHGLLKDPLAGRRPQRPGRPGGRGLLMVNLLADLVRTRTGEAGTRMRAYFALPA